MDYIKNPVLVITRRLTYPGGNIIIDYPVVIGMANTAVQQRINTSILNTVNRLIKEQYDQLLSQGYQNPQISSMGWYELKTNERDVLSLSIGNYTIATPAAHGLTIVRSLTFDTATGKAYRLSELFKPGSNYVKVLSDIISEQIKERGITLLDDFKGIKPEQDYYIADKALVVYFQVYEITAYVYGLQFFPISVYDIQDIIREGTPLGRMLHN